MVAIVCIIAYIDIYLTIMGVDNTYKRTFARLNERTNETRAALGSGFSNERPDEVDCGARVGTSM
jgi:hypothetical protein